MNKNKIIKLFDDEKYEEVIKLTNPYGKDNIFDFDILYYLKAKLVLDDYEINNKEEIKMLIFYYFYLIGEVKFENNYTFYFNKKLLKLDFNNLEKEIEGLKDFKQFFDLGNKNFFLTELKYITIKNDLNNVERTQKKVVNLVDFTIFYIYECLELYTLSGKNFPLFKWLINKIINEK